MKVIKGRIKYFMLSMMATMFVLVLFTGLVIVERNARTVIFGDNLAFFEYEQSDYKITKVKFHFMGKDYTLNF